MQLDAAWLAAQLDPVWLALLACYVAVFGGILVYSDFLPYTFDNNESFSAFWHARNMYEYGIANSSGLADESFSYDAAAHPYVYTHAGASPRLFAYLLYVLGIRTIELQIAVTVFTVGLLSFWFAYRFLAEISTRLYATIACLVLMTDYIMFAQWHVGAWHVWKMFLLFGGLYLAQRVVSRKQAYPLLMVYAFHAFLFYYETVFNVYVAAAVFLYFAFSTRDYRFAVKFGLAQFAGALTAAVILLGQLVLQLGWDVVRTDIYYTFMGRNFTTDSAAFLEEAKKFYADHNIVFWLNAPEISPYRNLLWMVRSLFRDHAMHTPPWSLVVLAFAAAEIVRRLRSRRPPSSAIAAAPPRASAVRSKLLVKIDLESAAKDARVLAPYLLAALSAVTLWILFSHPEISAGLAPPPTFWSWELWPFVIGIGLLAVVVALRRLFRSGAARLRGLPKFPDRDDRELPKFLDRIDWELPKFLDRIDWDLVIKDATLLVSLLLMALIIAVFYVLAGGFEAWAGIATLSSWLVEWWPILIGTGILVAAMAFRRSLRAHLLPRLSKFFARVDWQSVVKDAIVVAPPVLVALTVSAAIGVGILIVAILFRRPLEQRALLVLNELFGRNEAAAVSFDASLHARTLPRVRKFFVGIDWKPLARGTVPALVLLAALSAVVLFEFLFGNREAGTVATLSPIVIGVGIVAAAVLLRSLRALPRHFMALLATRRLEPLSRYLPVADPAPVLRASAFVAAVLAFLLIQPSLYAGTAALQPVWQAALTELGSYRIGGTLFLSGMLLLAAWYACGSSAGTERDSLPQSSPDRLLVALAALLAAYLLVYFVFTGYVLTGYFVRFLSMTVFFNDFLLALGLVAMIECVRRGYACFKQSTRWRRIVYGGGTAAAAVGLAGTIFYWGGLQAYLLRKLPPDEISFLPILSKPPFRGATFAGSMYGGPVAYFTKNWAYLDGYAALAEGKVTLGPDGYEVEGYSPYVWFADRAVNPTYDKPEYFLAKTSQFYELAQRLGPADSLDEAIARRPRVDDVPLIHAIREGRTSYLRPVEVARDSSPLDRWSIVRLDWDFPPFLRPWDGGKFVTLDASTTPDGTRIHVNYRYAHQDGAPEAGTRVTLFAQAHCADAGKILRCQFLP